MVKRKCLKEGEPSPHVAAPAGAWDPRAASCDGCWAAPSERRRKDTEKPENQAVDAVSRGGRWLHVPRGAINKKGGTVLLSDPCHPNLETEHPGDAAPISPSVSCRLMKMMAAEDGRGAFPRSHSEHSPGPLPRHRGLLSLGISWGTSESRAGGLALK